MFTGLIQATGFVLALTPRRGAALRLTISATALAGRWSTGDSIAVNGVCLTALDMGTSEEAHLGCFAADLAEETIRRSTLTGLQPGALVNLELPTPAGAPLGGHIVQGHVDAVGIVTSLLPLQEDLDAADWRLSVTLPADLLDFVIPQGSLTVDGISLTVAKLHDDQAEFAIVPHTYKSTNLRGLFAGAAVNLEADVLSKYGARQVPPPRAAEADMLSVAYLMANGF